MSLPAVGLPPDLFEQSIAQRFEEVARRCPDHPALVSAAGSLTYAELRERAGQAATELIGRLGTGREVVATALGHDLAAVIVMLAAMRAGKVFMPLDPTATSQVGAAAVRDAGAPLVVTDASSLAAATETFDGIAEVLDCSALLVGGTGAEVHSDPGDDAVLLYTSGTRGEPKGVSISHRSELHSVLNLAEGMHLGPGQNFWEPFSLTFSAAILWSLAPLMSGAALWLYDVRSRGLGGLPGELARGRATAVALVPSLLRELVAIAAPEDLCTIETVVVGGERFLPSDVARAREVFPDSCAFLQVLGSTEAIVVGWSPAGEGEGDAEDLPLHPFPDTDFEILDARGDGGGVGGVGELVVCSRYLSKGYWNRPELTRDSFQVAADGAQRFRTGDLGWLDESGRLHFIGRDDGRVKVRGQRVELPAVEAAIVAVGCVRTAAVASVETDNGTALVAFVVPRGIEEGNVRGEVLAALRSVLPSAAVPRIVVVDELPLLPSGKLDRQAVIAAARAAAHPQGPEEHAPPRDEIERSLVRIWEEMLEPPVGIDQDFFELGGDSLLAMEMLVEIEERLSCSLTPAALLRAPTIESLANVIRDPAHGSQPQSASDDRPGLFLAYPLGGNGFVYRWLADALVDELDVHLLEAPWWDGKPTKIRTVEQLATHHVSQIQQRQPSGPYLLAGSSFGGLLALEIARQLAGVGQEIAVVAVLDTYIGEPLEAGSDPRNWLMPAPTSVRHQILRRLWLLGAIQRYRVGAAGRRVARVAHRPRWWLDQHVLGAVPERRRADYVYDRGVRAYEAYRPLPYAGQVTLFRCTLDRWPAPDRGWGAVAQGGLEIRDLPGKHGEPLHPPLVERFASELLEVVGRARHGQLIPR
jgi:acyl-CoA synthetase (AMP-forming)/AMP-acid ligase II/thioesterase domain-containing protein/acyl carrier protein